MSVEIARDADGSLRLIGSIDFDNVLECRRQGERLLDAIDDRAGSVCISLARLEQPSSIAISLLLSWQRHALAYNKKLRFQAPPAALRQIITVCGLDTLFTFEP